MGTVLSLLVLMAIALLAGAFIAWRKGASGRRIALMVILAAVMIVNVGIWTIPDASGEAPLARLPGEEQP